jgi:hypothetical protein
MVCLSLAAGAFVSQFQALLSDMGIPGDKAALLGVWYAASVVIGRLICGSLLDRIWAAGVGFVCLTAPMIGLLLFLGGARPVWVLVVALYWSVSRSGRKPTCRPFSSLATSA